VQLRRTLSATFGQPADEDPVKVGVGDHAETSS
jgi:hypothetical protein